jgi:glycosyltransferase involved in cell wall biosynthesis
MRDWPRPPWLRRRQPEQRRAPGQGGAKPAPPEAELKQIGVNLLWLVPGVVGGSESYIVRLLRAVAAAPPDDLRITLFVNRRFVEAHPDLLTAFPSVVAPVSGTNKGLRVAAETTWLGREMLRRGVDGAHHVGGIAPAWRPVPTIVTVHDLQPFEFPEHFSVAKRTFTRVVVPPSLRSAALLTSLSASTRDDVVRRLAIDPDKVRVIPPGFDPPGPGASPEHRREVRERLGLGNRPFFLLPAITYPHKNHVLVVRAFAALARRVPEPLLVFTGGEGGAEELVRSAVRASGVGDRIRRVGRVADDDLDALYREAVAMVFPSRYEGFGMPVLEAMSRRCPVVAADATALPEVVAGAGLLLDPGDPAPWTAAMVQLLDDRGAARQLAEAGEARARSFDWAVAATRLADVYRELPVRKDR